MRAMWIFVGLLSLVPFAHAGHRSGGSHSRGSVSYGSPMGASPYYRGGYSGPVYSGGQYSGSYPSSRSYPSYSSGWYPVESYSSGWYPAESYYPQQSSSQWRVVPNPSSGTRYYYPSHSSNVPAQTYEVWDGDTVYYVQSPSGQPAARPAARPAQTEPRIESPPQKPVSKLVLQVPWEDAEVRIAGQVRQGKGLERVFNFDVPAGASSTLAVVMSVDRHGKRYEYDYNFELKSGDTLRKTLAFERPSRETDMFLVGVSKEREQERQKTQSWLAAYHKYLSERRQAVEQWSKDSSDESIVAERGRRLGFLDSIEGKLKALSSSESEATGTFFSEMEESYELEGTQVIPVLQQELGNLWRSQQEARKKLAQELQTELDAEHERWNQFKQ